MAKILLIEDNRDISQNVKEYLELEGHKVVASYDGEDGITRATEEKYDLILLDLMLPEVDGISIARRVMQKNPTPIIMTTARETLSDRLTGFEVGAVDYLVKPFNLSELHARIQVHLKSSLGSVSNDEKKSHSLKVAGVDIDLKKHVFKKDGVSVHLTQKEFLIMEKLIQLQDSVVSRLDIIEYLWGGDSLFDGDNKLDVYISNIRSKLGKNIITTVKGVGYTLGE